VTFSVEAEGTALEYQWYKDGEKIEGATGSSVTIVSVSEEDAGIYNVTVENVLDKVTSSLATLTVLPKPVVSVTLSFPVGYIPNKTADVTLTINCTDNTLALSTLTYNEILPAGWTFNSMIEDGGMDLMPKSGSEGELNFVWFLSDIPELPFTITYRVNVPEEYGFYEWYGEICAAGWTGDPEICDIDGDNQVTLESIE